MKRFLFLAMVVLIVVAVGVPAFALPTAYVIESRVGGGGQNSLFTCSSYATTSTATAASLSSWTCTELPSGSTITALRQAGSAYWFERTGANWGQWNFTPPTGKGGYYKISTAWGSSPSWQPAQQPMHYAVANASGVDVTTDILQTSVNANQWQDLTAGGEVQLNSGTAYAVRGTTPTLAADDNNKRVFWGATVFIFQRTNEATGLTATANGGTAINLAWTAPTPTPASYNIERSDDGGTTWSSLATGVTTATYSDTTGVCGITYQFRVSAVDAGGVISAPCAPAAALKCANTPPTQASNPTPVDGTTLVHTNFTPLSWTPGTGAVSQQVNFGTSAGSMAPIGGSQGPMVTNLAPPALAANTQYYWQVDEINSAGTTHGPVWTFKTGVSVTIQALRAGSHGSITYPVSPDPMSHWGDTGWFDGGQNLTFTVAPTDPFTWVGWSLSATGSPIFSTNTTLDAGNSMPDQFIVPSTNTTLYAVFQGAHYTLNVVDSPSAGGTVVATNKSWPAAGTDLTQFELGEQAHLVATPAAGYMFAGWESNKGGTFANAFAATTDYTMTGDNTTVTAYFATANAKVVDTNPMSIYAADLNGSFSNAATGTVNLGSYTNTNNCWYSRVVLFPPLNLDGTVKPNTIPAMSLRSGLGKLSVWHLNGGNYSSSLSLNCSAYPITTPWIGTTDIAGADWIIASNPTAGPLVNWTTKGGDMDKTHMLGAPTSWDGNPPNPVEKLWTLPTGVDYRTLLANGVELEADASQEGTINYRKGVGTGSTGSGTVAPTLSFFYNAPAGAANVIRNWAYLGYYPQGVDNDHQLRIDSDQAKGTYNLVPVDETQIAPNLSSAVAFGNAAFTTATNPWRSFSSTTDSIDLNTSFYGAVRPDCTTYAACYVNNPGADIYPSFLAIGSDDYSKLWTNGINRGTKAVAEGLYLDQKLIGPFTLRAGWNRLVIKIENGASGYGLTARLANSDLTALTGLSTLTFATTDATAPLNPTSTTCPGVTSGVPQTDVTSPVFTFSGATDPQGTGEGISGVRGYLVYFGSNAAGVPDTFVEDYPADPAPKHVFAPAGPLTTGTYYLRVSTVDYALNTSAVQNAFTFIIGTPGPLPAPTSTSVTKITDLWPLVADGTTEYGFFGANAKTVAAVFANGSFSIEETTRNAGVKVVVPAGTYKYFDSGKTAIQAGDVVDVYGKLTVTAGCEKVLTTDYVRDYTAAGAGTPIPALGVTQRYIVGKQANANTPGLPTGKGLYNAGLFVKLAGKILSADPSNTFFQLDDKSFAGGIKVYWTGTVTAGTNVKVTGVVGMESNLPVIYATSIL